MDTVIDPLRDAAFIRALIDVLIVATIAGVVGTFIVVRGIGFLGDALAHSIFPGIVIAFLLDASLLIGALIAGLVTAALMAALTTNGRVRDNTAIGVIFTAAFALGVVILTERAIDGEELEHILFGDPLGASWTDVALTGIIGAVVLALMLMLKRVFVMASFDPSGARAMGLRVSLLDVALLLLAALTVVISFKAVGNILVIALLITPAATARLLTDRLDYMMLLASALGAAASVVGLYIGHAQETSAGGAIVLVSTLMFFAAWLFAPRRGLVSELRARNDAGRLDEPEAEAELILASPEMREPHLT